MKKIKEILRRLGTPKLIRLYGEASVESISEILQDGITEIKLVELILLKHGRQLLANKSIRLVLYAGLSDQEQGYILDGIDQKGRLLSRAEKEGLTKLNWGRGITSTKRALSVFDLDTTYLPELYKAPQSLEVIKPDVYLYPHQQRLKDNFIRKLNDGVERLLVHMPTGAGKTRTSIEGLIDYWKANSDRKKNIIWLAHSEELCEQAVETFIKIWAVRGDAEINVCRYWGKHTAPDLDKGNNFIVAGFQKLYSMLSSSNNESFRLISSLKTSTGFIIVDEAHKAVAPTYKACIEYLFNPGVTKLVGLSATPGRDNLDTNSVQKKGSSTTDLADFFDMNRIGLTDSDGLEIPEPISYLQSNGFLSKINRKKITTNINLELTEKEKEFVSNFLELPESVLTQLASNNERNALILAEIAALRLSDKKIIVFALSVDHAHLITELLNLKGISASCIDGNSTAFERSDAIARYKSSEDELSVLVNYGVLTTGFDAPNTNAVVIARPTASLVLYSQMIGRGIRGPKVGGNAVCELIDLEDNLLGFPDEQQAFNFFNFAWSK